MGGEKKEGGLLLLIRISSSLRLRFALILALVLLASVFAAPATAQSTDQESEQEGESGDADQLGEVLNEGDNANQCVALQPVTNTGNALTAVDLIIQFPTRQEAKRLDIKAVLDLIDELDLELEDIGSTMSSTQSRRSSAPRSWTRPQRPANKARETSTRRGAGMRNPRLFSYLLGNQSNRPRQGQTSVLFYRFKWDEKAKIMLRTEPTMAHVDDRRSKADPQEGELRPCPSTTTLLPASTSATATAISACWTPRVAR